MVSRWGCHSRQAWAGVAGVLVLLLAGLTVGVGNAQAPASSDQALVLDHQAGQAHQLPSLPGNLPAPSGPPEGPDGGPPVMSPEQQQALGQQMTQDREQYVNFLAKNLNVDPALVKAALEQTETDMKAARIAAVQQDVQNGRLTQDQANVMIQVIQAGPVLVPPSNAGSIPALPLPGAPVAPGR